MIRIAHCISDTNFGGAGRVLLHYCKEQDRKHFELTVFLPKGSALLPHLREAGVKIIELDGLYDRSLHWKDIGLLRRALKGFDLVHAHGALSARIAARLAGVRVIYTRHSIFELKKISRFAPVRWLKGLIERLFADGIIAVSPAAKELLVQSGTPSSMIRVIFNGVAPLKREEPIYREEGFMVGIAARLTKVKGHEDLLRAFAALPEGIKLLIAGEGPEEQALRTLSEELGLSERVRFLGFTQEIAGLMSSLDLQINASFGTEATSMALLEGFSLGVPAVVTDFGGNPYVVEAGVSGEIVPAREPAAMAEAILRIAKDSAYHQRLQQGAAEAYQKKFRAARMVRETESYYREVLANEKKV